MLEKNQWIQMAEVAQLTIDRSRDAIFWHRGPQIVYVNEQACRSLGYSRDELQSMTLDDIDDGLSSQEKRQLMEHILNAGSAVFETINVRKDGTRFPVELSVTAHELHGETLFCGIARDISERKAAEEKLQSSQQRLEATVEELLAAERRYKLAIEGGRLGTFEWILAEGGGAVSDSFFRLFGRKPGSVKPTYKTFAVQAHPDDRPQLERAFKAAQKSGRAVSHEARIIWPDGSIHWLEIRARFAYDESKQPVRLDGVVIDIDNKKTTQRHLEESEQALKLALEASEMGTWDWDLATGEMTCSSFAFQILGYEPNEIEATFKVFTEHVHPDDRDMVLSTLERIRLSGSEHHLEHRIITAQGQTRWIEVKGRYFFDNKGNALRMRGVVMDITKRKEAEEELQLRRFAVDVAGEALFTLRMDGQFVDVNQVACARLGYERDALLKMKIQDISVSDSTMDFADHVTQLKREGSRLFPGQHRCRNGNIIDVEVSEKLLRFKGQQYICATARDVTKLRQANEKLRDLNQQLAHMNRLASLGEMASTIAHELNQPLAVICNSASLLQENVRSGFLNSTEAESLTELISSQSVLAGEIVRRMRGFCLNKPPERSTIDLSEVIEESVQLLRPELRHSSVDVFLQLEAVSNLKVDRVQFQQVLVNLIHNAIEAMANTPPERRQLRITARRSNIASVRISVADRGTGITAEHAERIFTPFASTKENGMGMGLPISRSIIEAHDGKLFVDEESQQGAVFHIDLCISKEELSNHASPDSD